MQTTIRRIPSPNRSERNTPACDRLEHRDAAGRRVCAECGERREYMTVYGYTVICMDCLTSNHLAPR